METVLKSLLFIHITTGFISLILFWIPVITRKGGTAHRKIGKAYVILMWVVALTAAILSVKNLIIGRTIMGAFLGFISLITANPLWYGIAVLKEKESVSAGYRKRHLAFRVTIVVTAIALITYGIMLGGKGGAVLMFFFGGLGLTDLPAIVKALRNPPQKANWLKDHIVGMCTSAIAAYTAFFVFGANQFFEELLPGYWSILPWVAPTFVGTTGIIYSLRYYRKKRMID